MPFSSASCLHCLVPCLIPCCLILRCSILVCDALCYPSPLPHLSVASLMLAEQSASFSLFVLHCFPTPLSHSFLTLLQHCSRALLHTHWLELIVLTTQSTQVESSGQGPPRHPLQWRHLRAGDRSASKLSAHRTFCENPHAHLPPELPFQGAILAASPPLPAFLSLLLLAPCLY